MSSVSPAVFIAVVGCQAPVLPAPTVSSVEPPFGSSQDSTSLVVRGANFWPVVHVATGNGEPELESDFDVWLHGPDGAPVRHQAASVRWVRSGRLNATVDPGLDAGIYDVEVVGPSGRSGTLPRGFEVTSFRAEQLVLDAVGLPPWKVTDPEPPKVDLTLSSLTGDVVPLDIAVTVTLDPDQDDPEAYLSSDTLFPDASGLVLRGTLREGQGQITVVSGVPGLLHLSVSADDDELAIVPDSLDLLFEPGDDHRIQFDFVGGPPAEIVAGVPFTMQAELVDIPGNRVVGSASITLRTVCGTWFSDPDVQIVNGLAEFLVTPTRATNENFCPKEIVVVQRGPPGESEGFEVLPGVVSHFAVDVTADAQPPRAGDPLRVFVSPTDEYGNPSPWSGELTIEASTGGFVPDGDCMPLVNTQLECLGSATVADPNVHMLATGGNGTSGVSGDFTVLPDDMPFSLTVSGPPAATAGVPFDVDVHVEDEYGNAMDAAELTAAAFSFEDEVGDAQCGFATFLLDGAARFSCTLTTARPAAVLVADVGDVFGAAPAFEVHNGPLDAVALTAPSTVGAGAMFTLTAVGTDAWGNPYVDQTDPVVDLADDLGTLSLTQVTLGGTGTATVPVTLTRAGATVIRASQGGTELGVSGAVLVLPGPGTLLSLSPAVPWAFAHEPFVVSIQALDAFGNDADSEGDVLLTSLKTASPVQLVPLVDGFALGTFTWSTNVIDDTLVAEVSEVVARLHVTVATDCGELGPTTDLTFGGFDDAIACLDPVSGLADVTADLAGSDPGAVPLRAYVAGVLGHEGEFDVVPALTLTLDDEGPHAVGALVVDEAGCGSEVFATAWAGPDDGTAAGPITLSSSATELAVVDSQTVDVAGVVDCHRIAAAFAGIHVRTTAGALSGPVATGAGLEVFLDVDGNGSFGLDTVGALQNGVAEVHAWVDSGAAGGMLALPVVGDVVGPIVVAQWPSGATFAQVGEVRLTFSEPIQAAAAVPESFDVVGPIATTVLGASLEASDTEVVLSLLPPADGTAGTWTVGAITSVVDLAGNPLAGTWEPAIADYDGTFGDVAVAVDAVVCPAVDPAWLWFRPDGDPGPGVEADVLTVTLESASAPAWWVLDVFADDGTRRFHDRRVPLGANDTLTWDGRDFDGIVVPNGVWTVDVVPDDGFGNRAAGCSLPIVVANRSVVP